MDTKRRGFTLVELLMGILLSAAVCVTVVQLSRQATFIMTRVASQTLAWERGHNALSIIEPRVLHAAFGITFERTGDVFTRSFGGNTINSPPPGRWTDRRGPLQIWDGFPSLFNLAPNDGGVFRGRGIAVLYAIPSALRASTPDNAPITLNGGESARFRLIPSEELSTIATRLPTTARNDLRSWVTFPLMRLPAHAVFSAGELTIRMADGSGPSVLRPYDEMHYIRAARFYAQHEIMYSEELRTSWTNLENRLEGVLEMWFEWTPSKRLLEAWVLTTGGRALSSSGRTARPKGWPPEAPWRASFEFHDVAVVRGSWLLRNM